MANKRMGSTNHGQGGYRRKSGKSSRGTNSGRPHGKVDRGMNSVKKKGGRRK